MMGYATGHQMIADLLTGIQARDVLLVKKVGTSLRAFIKLRPDTHRTAECRHTSAGAVGVVCDGAGRKNSSRRRSGGVAPPQHSEEMPMKNIPSSFYHNALSSSPPQRPHTSAGHYGGVNNSRSPSPPNFGGQGGGGNNGGWGDGHGGDEEGAHASFLSFDQIVEQRKKKWRVQLKNSLATQEVGGTETNAFKYDRGPR